ncbi:phosphotransferase enzyme family protein [Celeribacter neptunius]|uniref:Phosphotransferase enzyme family protein n=1 Tax=Celeribacter neptunius TaxID=588602 RepID=A0A1I3LUX9_9RHOB|nr:phosphotransferase [Celeribacter neptunius]SFI88483.1 Phosphotransferase enzyme family protein [Celeribacter neptunius]
MTAGKLPPIHLWGIDAPLEPLSGGHRNAVFRTSELSRDLVFKSTRRDEAQIRWLSPVLGAAQAAGLSVAAPIPALDGRYVAEGWTCEPLIEGRPFQPDELPQIAERIDAFHAATTSLPQRPGFAAAHDLLAMDSGGDVTLSALPVELAQLCRKAWQGLAGSDGPDSPNGVIHGDLTAGNLIHSETGPALLDWDEARVDHRAFDLIRTHPADATAAQKTAALAWEVACSWEIEPEHARIVARVLERRI